MPGMCTALLTNLNKSFLTPCERTLLLYDRDFNERGNEDEEDIQQDARQIS